MEEESKIYRRLFESANAAILIIDPGFRIIECNKVALKMLCRKKAEVLGLTPTEISPEKQANGKMSVDLGATYFLAAKKGKDQRFEWVHAKKDGTTFSVEVSLFGFSSDGEVNYFAVWRDLMEVKKKEFELREIEERFRKIFTQSYDGLTLHEMGKGCVDCNVSALKMLGYTSKDELLGKTLDEISPEFQPNGINSLELAKEHYKTCLAKGVAKFEWVHLKKNKAEIYIDVTLTKISNQNRLLIYAHWRDLTEEKRQQEELNKYRNHLEDLVQLRTEELELAIKNLKEAQAQLVQSEKMSSLGVLTSGVAHEINNPLNYISGSYEALNMLLDQKFVEDQRIPLLLKNLKTGVDRAAQIVNGLNQFSSNNEGLDDLCNIHEILEGCLLMINHELKGRVVVEKNFSDKKMLVIGNVGKLHQVFINILINSVQAIEADGNIIINTASKEGQVVVEFVDDGHGVGKENLPKIYDPFFTTKAPGKGTGLGLSITYSIIKEHGGELEFSSEKDVGSTCVVLLPEADLDQ